jgi:COP9 signalosome complex subunit 12
MSAMQVALEPFRAAHAAQEVWDVSAMLSANAPREQPGRLYDFYRASNEHQVENDIRAAIKYSKASRIPPKEAGAWVDIFVSYWKAVGEILRSDEATNQGRYSDQHAVAVYDAWKDFLNQIVKHISNGNLPHWTVVCMYVAASQLRTFAIKADEQLAKTKGNVTFNAGFQDDIVSTAPRNEKLEEAARVFNRMFALCLGDRNPNIRESRKWGTYYMANLQFKTYFKVGTCPGP